MEKYWKNMDFCGKIAKGKDRKAMDMTTRSHSSPKGAAY